MHKILEPCGFKASFMVKSVDCSDEEVSALGSIVLGLNYDPRKDKIFFQIVPMMTVHA